MSFEKGSKVIFRPNGLVYTVVHCDGSTTEIGTEIYCAGAGGEVGWKKYSFYVNTWQCEEYQAEYSEETPPQFRSESPLKRCPCGGFGVIFSDSDYGIQVRCVSCGCSAARESTEESAITQWNILVEASTSREKAFDDLMCEYAADSNSQPVLPKYEITRASNGDVAVTINLRTQRHKSWFHDSVAIVAAESGEFIGDVYRICCEDKGGMSKGEIQIKDVKRLSEEAA